MKKLCKSKVISIIVSIITIFGMMMPSIAAAASISPGDTCHAWVNGTQIFTGFWVTTGKYVICRPSPPTLPIDVSTQIGASCKIQRISKKALLTGKIYDEDATGSGYKCEKL